MSRADKGPRRLLIGGSLYLVGGVENGRHYGNIANHTGECQSASRSHLLWESVRHREGHLKRCEEIEQGREEEGDRGYFCVSAFISSSTVLNVTRNKGTGMVRYTVRISPLYFRKGEKSL